jgi:hypothetical protein
MSSSIPTQIQQTNYGFAPEIAPYAQTLLGQAQAVTDTSMNPYMQYQGERTAQFAPLQQLSYDNAALMQTQPQLQDATAMAGTAGLGALNTQYTFNPYQTQSFTSGTNAAPSYDASGNFQAGTGAVGQYMSPYMDTVVARQQADAQRQAQIAQQAQGAQAARTGAFGGSGDYLMRAQAAGNLARQKGDIAATGMQNAYQQAMQQFNQSQAQNLAGAQLNAQQGQFGAGLGLQGLQTALSGANTLGQLGQSQYTQNMGVNALQNQYGLQQQSQMQKDLDTKYQDFLNYQNYPYKQLSFMSDIIRGAPLTSTGSAIYQAPPSTAQTITSLGLGAAGISKLIGSAEGGLTRSMANGGVAMSNGGGLGALALNNLV